MNHPRTSLQALILLAVLLGGPNAVQGGLTEALVADFRPLTLDPRSKDLSPAARTLAEKAAQAFNTQRPVVDHHLHLVGMNQGYGTLCPELSAVSNTLTAKRFSWWHPIWRFKTWALQTASGITALERANEEYAARLLRLIQHFTLFAPIKLYLLAMDGRYREDGTFDPKQSDLIVPNAAVTGVADCLNAKVAGRPLIPAISVHPYRPDAAATLQHYHEQGVRAVKWLPSLQNIDPRHPKSLAFLAEMGRLCMTLLTHAGGEETMIVPKAEDQTLADPGHLFAALDQLGATAPRIVIAHAGRKGIPVAPPPGITTNFDLFQYGIAQERWQPYLFGDLSAVPLHDSVHHFDPFLDPARYPQWAGRIVNGSDYPLPAVKRLSDQSLKKLTDRSMLSATERTLLAEIAQVNPILYDFVLKRTLHHPEHADWTLPETFFSALPPYPAGSRCRLSP